MEDLYDIAATRAAGRAIRMTLPGLIRWMVADHRPAITRAVELANSYCTAGAPHVGSDTGSRMAVRLADGMSVETAAAREYRYRWSLCLDSWVNKVENDRSNRGRHGFGRNCIPTAFAPPHLLGA